MGQSRNYAQSSATVTTTAADIVPANKDRTSLIVFNTGTVDVLIGIGTPAITILAGQHLAFIDESAPMNAVRAATASGTGSLIIWEA